MKHENVNQSGTSVLCFGALRTSPLYVPNARVHKPAVSTGSGRQTAELKERKPRKKRNQFSLWWLTSLGTQMMDTGGSFTLKVTATVRSNTHLERKA